MIDFERLALFRKSDTSWWKHWRRTSLKVFKFSKLWLSNNVWFHLSPHPLRLTVLFSHFSAAAFLKPQTKIAHRFGLLWTFCSSIVADNVHQRCLVARSTNICFTHCTLWSMITFLSNQRACSSFFTQRFLYRDRRLVDCFLRFLLL